MHDWDEMQRPSDSSTERVRRHRKRAKELERNVTSNVTETAQIRLDTDKRRIREEEECAELLAGASVLLELPTHKNGVGYSLTEEKRDEYQETYPGLNVDQELRKARQWLTDNPKKRKTLRGMPAFLNNWLNRAQDRPRPGQGQRPVEQTYAERLAEIEQISRDMKDDK